MQHVGCQLAYTVRAFRAGQNARLTTDVDQSDESEKTVLALVFDDDWHTWLGDTDFFCASDEYGAVKKPCVFSLFRKQLLLPCRSRWWRS